MKKFGIALLVIIDIALFACGITGYIYNGKRVEPEPEKPVEKPQEVKYRYYLEDVEQDTMPQNETITNEDGTTTTNVLYKLSNFACSNGNSGEWNENTWTFTPTEIKDSECSLYFVKSKYEVTLTITNGTESEDNLKFIDRETNGVFGITPNEGYEFQEATCSDNKEATWNAANNTLEINAITKDVTCKVVFGIQNLTLDVTVTNGKGNTTETAKYGDSISAIVEPNTGYENPTVTCTNDQIATFDNNKITIEKLTKSTKCKVTFKKVQLEKFNLKIDTLPDTIKITAGSNSQEIESGKTGTFTLKADEGFEIDNISCGGITPSKETLADGSIKYSFIGMTSNITCSVTAKVK